MKYQKQNIIKQGNGNLIFIGGGVKSVISNFIERKQNIIRGGNDYLTFISFVIKFYRK